jgi:hypothetical protein
MQHVLSPVDHLGIANALHMSGVISPPVMAAEMLGLPYTPPDSKGKCQQQSVLQLSTVALHACVNRDQGHAHV